MEKDELVTFYTFDSSIPAYIMKGKLEEAGIVCFIFDEHHVTLNPFYANALGGIKLKVRVGDLQAAEKVVLETQEIATENENGEVVKCPRCGSEKMAGPFRSMKNKTGIFAAFLSFITSTYPLYYFMVYRCDNCGYELEIKED